MTLMSLEEDISELIQCTICIELLSDTRVLCCGHTFCLRCLQRYGKGKAAGDSVSCPVCRNRFQVPSGGFSSLPRNFLLEKILEIYAAASLVDDWMEESHPPTRGRSVAVQSTQTTTDATVEEDNPLTEQTLDEVEQVEVQHEQQHGQQEEQQQPQEQQQQHQQTQQQQRHRQQRQQQQQQLEQQRQQVHPNLVPQRRRPFTSRKGCSQRLLINTFLASLVLNFLLMGNLWYIQDSMEQERTNWTYREFEFEDEIQKLREESEDKQITIANHHLRCTERVESSLDECRNDLTFYKGFLQTVTKLLDSYTTPQQPTFSVM